MSIVAVWCDSSVIRCRIATIGSRTGPWPPDSFALVGHRPRRSDRASAADERRPIGFVGDVLRFEPARDDEVQHPRRRLVPRTRPPRAQDRLSLRDDLRLHEEIGERRMQRIGGRRCEDDLRVARDLDHPARARAVGDPNPAQLDVVLRRDDDLGVGFEVVIAAPKLRARLREYGLVVRRAPQRRLVRSRPEVAARHVAEIAERSPVVAGAVFAPPGHREVLPAGAAATRVRDHDVQPAVRQELHLGRRRVGTVEHAHWRLRPAVDSAYGRELGGLRE